MEKIEEADHLAARILRWAGAPTKAEFHHLHKEPPMTCAAAGCGMYGPQEYCSCDWNCPTFRNCCEDYRDFCLHSCKQLGCGRFISGSNCSCDKKCRTKGNCCSDYRDECEMSTRGGRIPSFSRFNANSPGSEKDHDDLEFEDRPMRWETCRRLGCGRRGRHCACNHECMKYGDCCKDFVKACPRHELNCSIMGCGVRGHPGQCSCNEGCRRYNDCCEDYPGTCGLREA